MIKSEKRLKELASVLNKENNILINDEIRLLREEHPFEGAISLLTSFYNRTDDVLMRKTIEGFMNDLKDQSACPELISEIKKPWKPDTISMLVASCWQCGLDFSDYSLDLTKVFMEGDYVTALECLTVIEESVHKLTRERKDAMIDIIEKSSGTTVNEKTALSLELVSILNG